MMDWPTALTMAVAEICVTVYFCFKMYLDFMVGKTIHTKGGDEDAQS